MKKLGIPAMLVFLCMAAPGCGTGYERHDGRNHQGFPADRRVQGDGAGTEAASCRGSSDPDAREQETRQTIRQNCVAEHVDEALCDRITGMDIDKAKNK